METDGTTRKNNTEKVKREGTRKFVSLSVTFVVLEGLTTLLPSSTGPSGTS